MKYTTYVPFTMAMGGLPPSTLGYQATLAKETLFWAVRYLYNYAQLKRNRMIAPINALQEMDEQNNQKRKNARHLLERDTRERRHAERRRRRQDRARRLE